MSFFGGLSLSALAAVFAATPAATRSLSAIEMRGVISLCAHPDALPFASRKDNPPGFQVELAQALAQRLGVSLDVAWVMSRVQFRAAECDIVLDTIVNREAQAETRMQVSKPYHRSGVALVLPAGVQGTSSFHDLDKSKRIGVQKGSLAQMILSQRGHQTTPFDYEGEMVDALAEGSIDAAAISPASAGFFNIRHPQQALRIVHAYDQEPELSWTVAVGMRGADTPLRQRIDAAIEQMLADGTIRTIYARYGVEHRPPVATK
ncbi:MAG TPA: transporter substrate-binding domain-containing protein [Vineibacter sp.]|nr:transporter substrate-binding domain-containing protein [Vineibacter sp.]